MNKKTLLIRKLKGRRWKRKSMGMYWYESRWRKEKPLPPVQQSVTERGEERWKRREVEGKERQREWGCAAHTHIHTGSGMWRKLARNLSISLPFFPSVCVPSSVISTLTHYFSFTDILLFFSLSLKRKVPSIIVPIQIWKLFFLRSLKTTSQWDFCAESDEAGGIK